LTFYFNLTLAPVKEQSNWIRSTAVSGR